MASTRFLQQSAPLFPPSVLLSTNTSRPSNSASHRTGPNNRTTDCPRNRSTSRSPRDKARASRRDFPWTEAKRDVDPTRDTERDIELTLAHWKLNGAGGVVEGVGRHGVVVGVIRPITQ